MMLYSAGNTLALTTTDLKEYVSADTIQWFQNNSVDPFQITPAASDWKVEALIKYCKGIETRETIQWN